MSDSELFKVSDLRRGMKSISKDTFVFPSIVNEGIINGDKFNDVLQPCGTSN